MKGKKGPELAVQVNGGEGFGTPMSAYEEWKSERNKKSLINWEYV